MPMFDKKEKHIPAEQQQTTGPSPQPIPEGPILTALRRERIVVLVKLNATNKELSDLETKIAWFERNAKAETYFQEVGAILDSLRQS